MLYSPQSLESAVSASRTAGRAGRQGKDPPETGVGLARYVIDNVVGSWTKTFQLAFLVCAPLIAGEAFVMLTAVVFFYLRLGTERWVVAGGSAVTVLGGVLAAIGRWRIRRRLKAVTMTLDKPDGTPDSPLPSPPQTPPCIAEGHADCA
jgi:hypothetical protein